MSSLSPHASTLAIRSTLGLGGDALAFEAPVTPPARPLTRIAPAIDTLDGAIGFLIRRYAALVPLDAGDESVFRSLQGPIEETPRAREFSGRSTSPSTPRFLIDGWACRFRLLGDGRRKIIGFLLPGDAIGIHERPRPLSHCSTSALTACRTLSASPAFDSVLSLRSANPQLAEALRAASAIEETFLLDHVVRLGRQTAFERMAHLLLELHWRLLQVGRVDGWRMALPLTQELLADALGLSLVHVNRTVQHLRRQRLIEWRHHSVTILDPERLTEIAEFRPPRASDWT